MPAELVWGIVLTVVGAIIFVVLLVVSIPTLMWVLMKGFGGGFGKKIDAGEVAPARIVSLEQGQVKMTLGGVQDYWRPVLTLRVEPRNGEPYQTTLTEMVSVLDIPQYQPGALLLVGIDKTDRMRVGIVQNLTKIMAGMQFGGMDKDTAEKIIAIYETNCYELPITGVKVEGEVTALEETGVSNQDGVLKKLTLRVSPKDGESYEAEAYALIKTSSLDKYARGTKVNVAYDAADKKRVSLLGRIDA